jgi:pimeloyl-ACP methyl ester carboxylesterase
MAAKWVDLLRVRVSSAPSIAQAITRPNISFLSTPFGALRIRDSGGHTPSVVFACDAPNVLEHYDAIFSLLSPSYRLICIEMPGFGFSYPSSSFNFSMQQYVDVVEQVIKKLGVGPATLMFPCAWSYVAFKLAAQRPALVERLIVSQCPCWDEEQAWTKRIDSNGMMGKPLIGQVFLATNTKRVSDGWYDAALPKGRSASEFAEPARKVLSDGGIFCLASMIQAWFHVKNPSFMVEQPTVVMWGGSDRTHRRSNPESVLQYFRRGKVVTYPGAGHFPELEDPSSLKSLLLNEDLWSGLKGKETNPESEGDMEKDRASPSSGKGQATGAVPLSRQRKPFDSHL